MKFKNYIDILKGKKIDNRLITTIKSSGNIPYVCACDIRQKSYKDIPKTVYHISRNISKILKLDLAREGDILFVKSGSTQGHLCLIHTKGVRAYYNRDEIFCIRTKKNAVPKFMCSLIEKYVEKAKKEAFNSEDLSVDPIFTPEKLLQSEVPSYSLKKQYKIRKYYYSLISKEYKADQMIDAIMQDLVYLYRSYFEGDTSPKVTVGSTLEHYLRYNETIPEGPDSYKLLHIWKDLKVSDGQTFDDLYHFVKSETPSFSEDFPMHHDCAYISIDGSDIGECGLYHEELFKKSIYFALTPTEKYPAMYLYFILSFHSCLTKTKDANNGLAILPSSIENYPLSTDYDRIAQFSQAVEEPVNDIKGITEDISNMKKLRLSIFQKVFDNELDIATLKKELDKYNIYR